MKREEKLYKLIKLKYTMTYEIPIVNKNDKIIKHKKRSEVLQSDICRVSALWITNSNKEVLIAKRAMTKKNHPGLWGPAVAGTVEKDETYYQSIVKETEEEIGIKTEDVKEHKKDFTNGKHIHFTMWYILNIDKKIEEFTIQKEEVDEIRWISYEKLKEEVKINPEKYLLSLGQKIKEGFFE